MNKLLIGTVAAAAAVTALVVGTGQASSEVANEATATPAGKGHGHYADVNGLRMYYEVHGPSNGRDNGQPPLVLLHGALSATGTSFGEVLPKLAKTRRVISVEQQAHGHTADIDRPLRIATMAEDTAALLRKIGVGKADIFGYSMGAGIALDLGIKHPDLVRKLVLAAVSFNKNGLHPGVLDGIDQLKPEHLYGSPFHEEYLKIAPRPQDFDRFVEKVKDLNKNIPDLPASAVASVKAPVLTIAGDSDIVRPEHAVELFRLFGGGVPGDNVGLPNSQLAILPGTTHVTLVQRADLLLPIVPAFLDAPVK
ncbi:alpha/beta fold hydrolase [Herbihabitans rhizosphaerae]|nr:alpha/beta hydrolase [Herbihabitans rhizosphaerae]